MLFSHNPAAISLSSFVHSLIIPPYSLHSSSVQRRLKNAVSSFRLCPSHTRVSFVWCKVSLILPRVLPFHAPLRLSQSISSFSHVLSCFSPVWLSAALWTVAARFLCPWGFSPWQEYWCGLPSPPPGIFSTQGSHPSLLYSLGYLEVLWGFLYFARSNQAVSTSKAPSLFLSL